MRILDLFNIFGSISAEDKYCLDLLQGEDEYENVKRLLKRKKVRFEIKKFDTSLADSDYFQLASDEEYSSLVEAVNIKLFNKGAVESFKKFSEKAFETVKSNIAPNLGNIDSIKKAIALQAFSNEGIHILLLADTRSGYPDLLNSPSSFIYNSAYGSTVSKTRPVAELLTEILSKANNSICSIDKLNITKRADLHILAQSMDTGVINTETSALPAKARILAIATPVGGKFERTVDSISRQLPFEQSMIERFSLMFLIREQHVKKLHLTRSLKEQDIAFLQEYVKYANSLEVAVPVQLEEQFERILQDLKRTQFKILVNLTPRLIITLRKLAKASARSELRTEVSQKDVDLAKEVLLDSLKVMI